MSSEDVPSDEPIVEDDLAPPPVAAAPPAEHGALKALRVLSVLVIVAGVILLAAGVVTWFVVGDELAQEKIVVSDDADRFAGDPVDGPFTAYVEADTIRKHALSASDGKTYAELDQDDPARQTVMTASFLRASLFTSVVSFGVAAFAAAMGVLMMIVGYVLLKLTKVVANVPSATPTNA